uniref:Uncharacterized protein n=1 Tax=Acrobeloides nanus TaxID=290746 RepID=A0A914CNH1_9BILA
MPRKIVSILSLALILLCLVQDVPSTVIVQCPGGPFLAVGCDPTRPWPQCPPLTYCYGSDAGYFCCPIIQ